MVKNKKVINSDFLKRIFGRKSITYSESLISFIHQSGVNKDSFNNYFDEWKSVFKPIYGLNTTRELFLDHCYYILILRSLLIQTISNSKGQDFPKTIEYLRDSQYIKIYLTEFKYVNWIRVDYSNIFTLLENSQFFDEDIFQGLYQELFETSTRHHTGEYYTVPRLVHKMVADTYEFGFKALDPSCGSGSFLLEIVLTILRSNHKISEKVYAIENIYGFDINPLATLTTKLNLIIILIDYFGQNLEDLPKLNILMMDGLFPKEFENGYTQVESNLNKKFDLIIGNPPWLTYKDIPDRMYQKRLRSLAEILGIKPASQYITHIELAALFFYAAPYYFLKTNGTIFFVITKSVLNGDHCYRFRAFKPFRNLEIWDFPNAYFFNVEHICLKAVYGESDKDPVQSKYPIQTKIFDNNLNHISTTNYTSVKVDLDGSKIIIPEQKLKELTRITDSPYKRAFFQGATLVPRTLVFFEIVDETEDHYLISSDLDTLSRSKRKWKFSFQNKKIEKHFRFLTFLNKDLVPFGIKKFRNVFLPINDDYINDDGYLSKNPLAASFYKEMNEIYVNKKKESSVIEDLFSNLNYWNKLTKQANNDNYIVIYNASGSRLKSCVIDNSGKKVIIGSENYYYSTNSQYEAHYLCAILNAPLLSMNIRLIKSSRHLHKRPFAFPIPLYDDNNENHRHLATKGKKYHKVTNDLLYNNPEITAEKIRIFMHQKLKKIDDLARKIVFDS